MGMGGAKSYFVREIVTDLATWDDQALQVRELTRVEDCRERYLEEFASHLCEDSSTGMGREFRRLMLRWQDSRNA